MAVRVPSSDALNVDSSGSYFFPPPCNKVIVLSGSLSGPAGRALKLPDKISLRCWVAVSRRLPPLERRASVVSSEEHTHRRRGVCRSSSNTTGPK